MQTLHGTPLHKRLMTTVTVVALASFGGSIGVLAYDPHAEETPTAQQPFWAAEPTASNLAVVHLPHGGWQGTGQAR